MLIGSDEPLAELVDRTAQNGEPGVYRWRYCASNCRRFAELNNTGSAAIPPGQRGFVTLLKNYREGWLHIDAVPPLITKAPVDDQAGLVRTIMSYNADRLNGVLARPGSEAPPALTPLMATPSYRATTIYIFIDSYVRAK